MKKLIVTGILSVFVVFMVNCSPKVANEVTAGPVPTSTQIQDKFTATQLNEGKIIWESHCDRCHKLYNPETRTPLGWNNILKKMIPKAKLDVHDATLVRAYLIANAGKPKAE